MHGLLLTSIHHVDFQIVPTYSIVLEFGSCYQTEETAQTHRHVLFHNKKKTVYLIEYSHSLELIIERVYPVNDKHSLG